MDFKTKNDQKNRFIKIKELYTRKKYNALIKEATTYLNISPTDVSVRYMRAKAYRKKEMFSEAVNDLEYNLNLELDESSLIEIYYLYYYLNMYKEALELLPILYKTGFIIPTSLLITEIVMKKSLGLPINISENNYVTSQIINYSEEFALKHISEHASKNENTNGYIFSKFNVRVNIKYLYEIVRNNIKNNKKVNKRETLEIYYFAIHNIGYNNSFPCNYIKVVVVPNTNNIISIYPVSDIQNSDFGYLECDMDKLFETKEKKKTKSISRADAFYKKYYNK